MKSKFLLITVVLTFVLVLTMYMMDNYTNIHLSNIVYPVVVILGVMSYLFGKWIVGAIDERPALYINRYMMAFLIKMMSFLIFLGVYVYLNPENKLQIAMTLFVCYLIFNINMIVFLQIAEKNSKIKKSN